MGHPTFATWAACVLAACAAPRQLETSAASAVDTAPEIRLVLQVTVDQLRGDAIARNLERFAEGGFRRLVDDGIWFSEANYRHATTFTAVGHATLATGAGPVGHGVVGNSWSVDGEQVYCVEDARYELVGAAPGQQSKAHQGTSPRNLIGSTLGDELVEAGGGRARVFSVSIKDRGAILPGGRLGKAFWYSKTTGGFQSSSYYFERLPAWAAEWNREHGLASLAGRTWQLSARPELYRTQDERDFEVPPQGFDRSFPHELAEGLEGGLLRFTPLGDEHTLDFALTLLEVERLGRGPGTDMLAISFSANDYIGHAFGPESREVEDNLLRLDRTLARLFQAIDASVGFDRTLVVLSSDHGCDRAPERHHSTTCADKQGHEDWEPRNAGSVRGVAPFLRSKSDAELCCDEGRHFPSEMWAEVEVLMRARFEVADDLPPLIHSFWNPSLYLDPEVVVAEGLDLAEVEEAIAAELRSRPGIGRALTRTDLLAGSVPQGDAAVARMQRAFHPTRSGNVMLATAPGWFLYPVADDDAAMHGSPWRYDTHVPLFFAGASLEPSHVARAVGPEDLVPTVAALLGISAPAAADGEVLSEVLGPR